MSKEEKRFCFFSIALVSLIIFCVSFGLYIKSAYKKAKINGRLVSEIHTIQSLKENRIIDEDSTEQKNVLNNRKEIFKLVEKIDKSPIKDVDLTHSNIYIFGENGKFMRSNNEDILDFCSELDIEGNVLILETTKDVFSLGKESVSHINDLYFLATEKLSSDISEVYVLVETKDKTRVYILFPGWIDSSPNNVNWNYNNFFELDKKSLSLVYGNERKIEDLAFYIPDKIDGVKDKLKNDLKRIFGKKR